MDPDPQFPTDLLLLTEEILKRKLHLSVAHSTLENLKS